jgi:hypothetical protein
MIRASLCGAVGAILLVLGGVGLYSIQHAPASRVPLIYVSMMSGAVLLTFGILYARICILYGKQRKQNGPGTGTDASIATGIDVHHGSGHGADCGPSDGGGDCGGHGGSH